MKPRDFVPPSNRNGLLHPPQCVCVKCAAGRESRELDEPLRERLKEALDNAFINATVGNMLGGSQALSSGQPEHLVRQGFLGNMENIMTMREIAAAYFAQPQEDGK
jgi:hypothetical protein